LPQPEGTAAFRAVYFVAASLVYAWYTSLATLLAIEVSHPEPRPSQPRGAVSEVPLLSSGAPRRLPT
jgi:hypothetical protein